MSFNSSGVTLTSQFNLKSKQPLDGRYVITNETELENLISLALYPGLEFAVTENLTLTDGSIVNAGFYKVDIDGETITDIRSDSLTYQDITNFPTEKGISYPVNISQSFPFAENDSFIFPQYAKGMYIAAGGTDAVLFVTGHDGTSYSAYRSGETWQNPRKLLGTRDGNITISQSNTSEAYGLIQADNEVAFKGHSIDLSTKATTGEHARGIKWFNSDGSVFGAIGAHGTDGTLSDFYIGFTSEPWQPANSLKISADSIKWKGNELIHTGNASTSISKLSRAASQILTLDQTGDNPDASLAHNYIKYQINGVDKAASGYYKNMAFISNEVSSFARIGVNDSGEPQYWPGTDPTAAKTLIHAGNISEQTVAALKINSVNSSNIFNNTLNTSSFTLAEEIEINDESIAKYSKGLLFAGDDLAIMAIEPGVNIRAGYRSGNTWTFNTVITNANLNAYANKPISDALKAKITYGTADLTAGESSLGEGILYFVYE